MSVRILTGDCREVLATLPDESVHCVVTSPPYWGLRDYGVAGQIGLEATHLAFVDQMVAVFREVHRVLRSDGTCWINLGDSYASAWACNRRNEVGSGSLEKGKRADRPNRLSAGLKEKDLIGIPWRVAFALQEVGWYLRSEIIWAKPNGMPGSQQDRCTSSHETIFLLSKSSTYWSDFDAIKTPPRESTLVRLAQDVQAQAGSHRANGGAKTNGPMKAVAAKRDKQRGHSRRHAGFNERWDDMERSQQQSQPAMMRDVWFIPPGGYDGPHFAVMPDEVARRCILAGCPPDGTVLDPFGGAGTTGLVADRLGRDAILIELNAANADMALRRISDDAGMFGKVQAHPP